MNLDEIKKYFQDKVLEHGPTAEGMDWKDAATQYLRFEMIAKYIDFSSCPSILDVGCGGGEFLAFCEKKGHRCEYSGIDVVPEMVGFTNQRFGRDVAFQSDLESVPDSHKYDYVIASGTYNAKLTQDESSWRVFFYDNVARMYALSNKGAIFNCMTEHVEWRYDRLYYPTLSDLSAFITKSLTRDFIFDHSYPLFEMTVFIPKNNG
jgi:cyclopropane fatty-acyl-phospholipid synthase-like methyltransferase